MTGDPTTERFPLRSKATGTTYDIRVAAPKDLPAEASEVPILFVLDADIHFDLRRRDRPLPGDRHFRLEKAFIVGARLRRARICRDGQAQDPDLTEPLSGEGRKQLASMTNFIGDQDGDAEAFLTFLVDELTPEIARRRPEASRERSILFGHSLGGLFVSYALLTRPGAFASYLAISPSLWWDGFSVLRHLPAFGERLKALSAPPNVLIAVGSQEQDRPAEVDPALGVSLADMQALVVAARMVDAAAEFATKLSASGLADVRHVAFAGESHMNCVPAAMVRGITTALKTSG